VTRPALHGLQAAVLTAGLALGASGLWLDYAYLPSGVGGDNQRLGIVLYRAKARTLPGTTEVKGTPAAPGTHPQRGSP